MLAESVGCTVLRAAGSHGTDLVVIDSGHTYGLDVKRNRWASPATRVAMAGEWKGKGEPWMVRVGIVGGKRRYTYARVMPDGSMGQRTNVAPWD